MSDDATQNQDANEGGSGAGQTPTGNEFTPITSQDDLNKIIGDRVKRAESKFADYASLQSKAAQFDALEEANKTEIQKAQDALAAAVAERDNALSEALRSKVQASYGISDADAQLFLTGPDEATLQAQAKALAERSKASGLAPVIPALGGKTDATGSTADQFATAFEAAFTR